MTETVTIVCIITLAVIIAIVLVALAVLLYNQMLMTNEINKRLLVMSKEAVEHDRATTEDLANAVQELNDMANETPQKSQQEESDEPFDPHAYLEEHTEL